MIGLILTIYLKTFRKMSRIPIVCSIWRKLYDIIKDVLKNKPAKIRLHGIKAEFDNDWHYDVIAFHEHTNYSILDFANSTYSRNKISSY